MKILKHEHNTLTHSLSLYTQSFQHTTHSQCTFSFFMFFYSIDWVQNYFKDKWNKVDSVENSNKTPEESSVEETMIL